MDTPRDFALTLLVPAILGVAVGILIGWALWHTVAFTVGLVTLVYSVGVWMGAEPPIRLEAPWIGVPLVAILAVLLWWAHFGTWFGPRPVTLMIQVLTCAPFVALTVSALFRLH